MEINVKSKFHPKGPNGLLQVKMDHIASVPMTNRVWCPLHRIVQWFVFCFECWESSSRILKRRKILTFRSKKEQGSNTHVNCTMYIDWEAVESKIFWKTMQHKKRGYKPFNKILRLGTYINAKTWIKRWFRVAIIEWWWKDLWNFCRKIDFSKIIALRLQIDVLNVLRADRKPTLLRRLTSVWGF